VTIELITGTPGSGKTTFAVAQRVASEVGREIALDDETCINLKLELGTKVKRRIVQAGIKGLLVEHERLPHILTRESTPDAEVQRWNALQPGASDTPVHMRLPGTPPVDCEPIIQNWWLWCKPGDLIVIDEAQFVMGRAGTMGRKPPFWIQAFEVHRHYGVDFLLITQHPNLIDTTIRALVGLHRHVRSVMGSALCMVYVWDHASNPERYSLASKEKFWRRAKHYALFKSSSAHIAPPTAGRGIVWLVPLLLVLGGLAAWQLSKRFTKPAEASPAALAASPAIRAGIAPAAVRVSPKPPRLVQGCYAVADHCRCLGLEGDWLKLGADMCRLSAASFDGLVKWERSRAVRYEPKQEAVAPSLAASTPAPPPPVKTL